MIAKKFQENENFSLGGALSVSEWLFRYVYPS